MTLDANNSQAHPKGIFAEVPPDHLSELEAEQLRKSSVFAEILNPDDAGKTNHLTLNELRHLQRQLRRLGADWEMPEHLMACPLCLEAFQCLQEGLPELSEQARSRFEGLFDQETKPIRMQTARVHWAKRILKMAAAILLLASGSMLMWTVSRPMARLDSGMLVIERGNRTLAEKAALPKNTLLVARENTSAVFADGATAMFAPASRVMISRSLAGDTMIQLQQGQVEASVPRQKQGRHFVVQTPLGDVRVIGTRFRVSTESERVLVYENSGDAQARAYSNRISAVTVQVESGVVAVDNHHDQVKITAGQCATMREGQKLIEVREAAQ